MLLVAKVQLVPQEPQEIQALRVLRALQEPQVQCLDLQVQLVRLALQAPLVPQEVRVQQDLLVQQVLLELLVLQVLREVLATLVLLGLLV